MNPSIDEEGRAAIGDLRFRAGLLFSEQAIRNWVFDAVTLGIDPF